MRTVTVSHNWYSFPRCSGTAIPTVFSVLLSGEAFSLGWFRLSTGIDPMYRGPASLEVVSKSSESTAQAALQGLTCEKKTESILVKVADLYIK